jgi:hypothetical protein
MQLAPFLSRIEHNIENLSISANKMGINALSQILWQSLIITAIRKG